MWQTLLCSDKTHPYYGSASNKSSAVVLQYFWNSSFDFSRASPPIGCLSSRTTWQRLTGAFIVVLWPCNLHERLISSALSAAAAIVKQRDHYQIRLSISEAAADKQASKLLHSAGDEIRGGIHDVSPIYKRGEWKCDERSSIKGLKIERPFYFFPPDLILSLILMVQ